MPAEKTPTEIWKRFLAESQRISQYIDFVLSKAAIKNVAIRDMNKILKANNIVTITVQPRALSDYAWSPEQITTLLGTLDKIQPAVQKRIEALTLAMAPIARPDDHYDEDALHHLDEWVAFFDNELPDEPTNNYLTEAPQRYFEQAEWENPDSDIPSETKWQIVQDAFQIVIRNKNIENLQRLEHTLWQFDQIRFAARVSLPDADLNILRQAFILLMTAFDAAIFDLLRVALTGHFFELIPKIAKDGSFKLKDMARFHNFDEFSNNVIETQLKARYVKDLLGFLSEIGVQLYDETTDKHVMLMELVQRRNVHIHNRGYVDERYLERNEDGKPKWNLDNLSLGDMAVIDHDYWEGALRLATNCVNAVATWVNSGAPAK
jgi:hypothetical protein